MPLVTPNLTLGGQPAQLDLDVRAGEPVDFSVPVLDAAGEAVSLTGWAGAAQIRDHPGGALLHTFIVTITGSSVRITTTTADTTTWTWKVGQWDILLTDPSGGGHVLCAGWVRVYPTITRS